MSGNEPIIRIVKKKAGHLSQHSGAWKVAYADFVTAMMAFFLVMWIIGMDQPVREMIQEYFNDPYAAAESKAGISKMAGGGRAPMSSGSRLGLDSDRGWRWVAHQAQRRRFEQVAERLREELARRPDLAHLRQHVIVRVENTGLVIELIDRDDSLFFRRGSPVLPVATRRLLTIIAGELGRLPNSVAIEGHTDSAPYRPGSSYGNWELSCDRANAARRVMESGGLRPRQVVEVRAYADHRPRDARHPTDAVNRRVSILVNYSEEEPGAAPEAVEGGPGRPLAERLSPELVPPAREWFVPESP